MEVERSTYRLNTWWLTYHEDENGGYWRLHGNNGMVDGNERFGRGELIETSRIKSVSEREDGFLFETENSLYFCRIVETIEERFAWFFDSGLWERMLSEIELKNYIETMKSIMAKRQEALQNQPPTEFPADGYILLALDAARPSYYCDVLYKKDGDFHNLQMKSTMVFEKSHIDLLEDSEEEIDTDNLALCYDIVGSNIIKLYSSLIFWVPFYVVNCGAEELVIKSFYGSYKLPANGKAYRIGAESEVAREAVY